MLQGIQSRSSLSETEIREVLELSHLCNECEGIDLEITLNFSMLRRRDGQEENDILCYADNRLVGFLGMYFISSNEEVELSGMVHPDYRGRGLAFALLKEAHSRLERRNVRHRLIVCDQASHSGQKFLKAIGAHFQFSEYSMYLETMPEQLQDTTLDLLPVRPHDKDNVAAILMESFGDSEEEVRGLIERNTSSAEHQMYIAKHNTLPIGTITVTRDGDDMFITAFAVHPKFQGKGYGRQILSQCIVHIDSESKGTTIKLDVQTENANALGLYKSCGFKQIAAYDYYSI